MEIGGDDYRAGGGPMHVAAGKITNPLYRASVKAGRQAGYPVTDDINGYQQKGVGRRDIRVRAGRRWSAYRAYLKPALKQPNLLLETAALSHHICLFEGRAVGVAYEWHGQRRQVGARREVIIAGGAVNSPQFLLMSGIGPGEVLRDGGVAVRHELPGVGRNLQDHLVVYVQMACRQPVSLFQATKPLWRLAVGLRWLATGGGVGASNLFEAGGFIRSRAGNEHPVLQYHFLLVTTNYGGANPRQGRGIKAHVGSMQPTSTGRVAIFDDNPRRPLEILFNQMATESDQLDMRAGVRLTREIFAQAAFDQIRVDELAPGPEVISDDAIDAFVRAHGESAYHPSWSCKMGQASDGTAVVDGAGQVHGLARLRVIDASIVPGNLNKPLIMNVEKLVGQLRGRALLAPSAAAVWIHPAWHSQALRRGSTAYYLD